MNKSETDSEKVDKIQSNKISKTVFWIMINVKVNRNLCNILIYFDLIYAQ